MKRIISAPGKMFEIDIETKKIVSYSQVKKEDYFFEKLKKEYEEFDCLKINNETGKLEITLEIEELKKQFQDQTNGKLNHLKYVVLNKKTGKPSLISASYISMFTKNKILSNDKIGSTIHFSILNRTYPNEAIICETGIFLGRYTAVYFYGNENKFCQTESLYLAQVGEEVYLIDKLIDLDTEKELEKTTYNYLIDIKKVKYYVDEETIIVPVEDVSSVLRLKNQQKLFIIKGIYPKSKF